MQSLGNLMAEHAVRLLQEQQLDEIERAITNAKRGAWDKWFRREWYRATVQIRRRFEKRCKNSAPRRNERWLGGETMAKRYFFDMGLLKKGLPRKSQKSLLTRAFFYLILHVIVLLR